MAKKVKRAGAARSPRPSLRTWLEQLDTAGELRRVKATPFERRLVA